jgi:nucleoside-diphosphate-sugar epimerase
MRILVTGGSGFIGAHTIAELVRAGHEVRALVRDRSRLDAALGPLGVDGVDHILGDVLDSDTVARAMDGQEGLLHAAAVYSWAPRQERAIRTTNVAAVENVLGAAVQRKLSPIVHVSSTVALMPTGGAPLSGDLPPGSPSGAYSRSKAEGERVARRYQEMTDALTITYPGQAFGPHDPYDGEGTLLVAGALKGQLSISFDGGGHGCDVRDVARLHAAIFKERPARGRFVVPGHYFDIKSIIETLADATGRPLKTRLAPAPVVRSIGRIGDVVARIVPVRPPLSDAMLWVASQKAHADDSLARERFGFEPCPYAQIITDTVRWLHETGRISGSEAGRLAS